MRNLFTGIVQGKAVVQEVEERKGQFDWEGPGEVDFLRVKIEFPEGAMAGVQMGASVAINGTCLTVTSIDGDAIEFDVIGETLRRTNLGALKPGVKCNYERSTRVGDEIGGHTVSGHVQTTAEVAEVARTENNERWQFRLREARWAKYVLAKGFVAVNGCSLTVGEVGDDWFSVYLIPETIRVTTFADLGVGGTVNVEVEAQTVAIVDTVERVVAKYLEDKALK